MCQARNDKVFGLDGIRVGDVPTRYLIGYEIGKPGNAFSDAIYRHFLDISPRVIDWDEPDKWKFSRMKVMAPDATSLTSFLNILSQS